MTRLTSCFLIGLFLMWALAFHFSFDAPYLLPKLIFGWVFLAFVTFRYHVVKSRTLFFLGWIGLGWFWSSEPLLYFEKCALYLSMFLFGCMSLSPISKKKLRKALVYGGLASAFYGGFQYFGLDFFDLDQAEQAIGFLGNSNLQAQFLMICVMVGRIKKDWIIYLLSLGMVLTGSKAVLVCLATWYLFQRSKRWLGFLLLLIGLFWGAQTALHLRDFGSFKQELKFQPEDEDLRDPGYHGKPFSVMARAQLFSDSFQLVQNSFWGHGCGQFPVAYLQASGESFLMTETYRVMRAHNLFLEWCVEFGWIALVLLLVWIFRAIKTLPAVWRWIWILQLALACVDVGYAHPFFFGFLLLLSPKSQKGEKVPWLFALPSLCSLLLVLTFFNALSFPGKKHIHPSWAMYRCSLSDEEILTLARRQFARDPSPHSAHVLVVLLENREDPIDMAEAQMLRHEFASRFPYYRFFSERNGGEVNGSL